MVFWSVRIGLFCRVSRGGCGFRRVQNVIEQLNNSVEVCEDLVSLYKLEGLYIAQ